MTQLDLSKTLRPKDAEELLLSMAKHGATCGNFGGKQYFCMPETPGLKPLLDQDLVRISVSKAA